MNGTYSLKDFCVNFNTNNKYKQGIYKIYHLSNINQLYIGSASGTYKYGGFANRFNKHLRDLRANIHCNKKLQNFINKYGIDGLRMEIIELCSPEKCIEREQYYINLYNPFYNIAKTAGNTLGVKPTLEHLIKVSKAILQYDLSGNFIAEHINATFASKFSGINSYLIRQCCRNENNISQSGGFQWRFKKGSTYSLKIDKYYKTTSFRVLCYYKNGKFYKEFESILEASIFLNIPVGNISRHLKDDSAFCYDYIFKLYKKDFPLEIELRKKIHKNQIRVIVRDLETNDITNYNSFREASKNFINRGTLNDKYKKGILSFNYKNYNIRMEKYKK